MAASQDGVARDRDLLRWAAREELACAIVQPARPAWGRARVVALRDGGPRPQLAVSQPRDVQSRRPLLLRAGDPVHLWSQRGFRSWRLAARVVAVGRVESASGGAIDAAWLPLPYRLLATACRLLGPPGPAQHRVRVEARRLGPDGAPGARHTLLETWIGRDASWTRRGSAALVEVSWRTVTVALPRAESMLRGVELLLSIELPDLSLRTQVHARVAAVLEAGDLVLQGLVFERRLEHISEEEHRETLRRAATL